MQILWINFLCHLFNRQVPGIRETDRFNITIRAVSNYGVGIPIFVDLRKFKEIPIISHSGNVPAQRDPTLGILVGVLLSVVCVAICALIIIRHRRCLKAAHHQHVNGNDGSTRSSAPTRPTQNRAPVATATTRVPTSSSQIPTSCTMDAHEMQTLIATSSTENIPIVNGNGLPKKSDSYANGAIVAHSNRNSAGNQHSPPPPPGKIAELGSLISSTPKSKHKTSTANNDHLKIISTNFGSHTAKSAAPDTAAYRRIDCDADPFGIEPTPNILCNGGSMMKTMLPPNKSVHSIVLNETKMPPTINKKASDDKTKTAKRTSNNMLNISIPSVFDDSQQSLLPDANATESSSASTSSGSVPMDRINGGKPPNCLFDVKTFDNGANQPIVENQRYMRSAALV